ncbi:FAD-dependent monooxygenase [Streptomyces sp. NPDC018031]|uniref:FAD-dependent monooxygenase n=1 Tax=Streptomyces sp. NPDC018031 TaxID=3365033 RepID=UPI00379F068D
MGSTDRTAPAPADTTPPTAADVIVVGAGPTGLLLAGDLAAAGHRVTLAERRPHKISNLTRAFSTHARTLELLDARGLADDLLKTGHTTTSLRVFGRGELSLADLPTRFPFLLATPQYEIERLLERRAVQAGVDFRYEHELTGIDQDSPEAPGSVTATLRTGDGRTVACSARYLVGADGHRSGVRQALSIPFPGESVLKSITLADVKLARPPRDLPALRVAPDSACFAFIAPFGDGYYRVIGWDRHHTAPEDAPVDLDEIKGLLIRTTGHDLGAHDPRWLSRFHSDERQAPTYRKGRCFLAGDAAHVHSPAGGQGMNTGLQDAANLSWKLSRVLHGASPDALLDTYQAERHPIGARVLRTSGALVRLAMAHHPAMRAVRALAGVTLDVLAPLRRRTAGQISGIDISYGPNARRVPDIALDGGGRLYEELRAGRFVHISPIGSHDTPAVPDAVPVHWRPTSPRTDSLLVRPDGYLTAPDLPL